MGKSGGKYLPLKSDSHLLLMPRFLGNIEAKVDSKGRIFFPAVFRKVLQSASEERIVLRKDVFQSCLVVYPERVWNEQMDYLRSRLNRWNGRHQQLFRQFVSDAERLEFDSNGRILIPKRFLQMAGIVTAVRCIGMGDTIELWSSSAIEDSMMDGEAFGQALEELLNENESHDVTR